jgi:hypothetical protein
LFCEFEYTSLVLAARDVSATEIKGCRVNMLDERRLRLLGHSPVLLG